MKKLTPKKIKEIRESNGWTQQRFADLLGLKTRGAVCRLESDNEKTVAIPTNPILKLILLAEKNPKILESLC